VGNAQDFKYALRVLRKNFGFAAAAMLLLALGIGTNTAIFGLMNALLLENLPVQDPSGLVIVGDPTQGELDLEIGAFYQNCEVNDSVIGLGTGS
jgi:hypothetical protein